MLAEGRGARVWWQCDGRSVIREFSLLMHTCSFSTWLYALRPHTLGASLAPMIVVLGALLSEGVMQWGLFALCLIVAVSAQIASNLANDYFDYIGGKDTEARIGFERLLSSGRVTPRAMLIALLVALAITSIAGLLLVSLQGWYLLLIGMGVLLGAVGYSAGPFPLSSHGLGDVAVVVFYGLVPVLGTWLALVGEPPLYLWFLALGIGLWEANILVVNNYRDYHEDQKSGKRTLVVRLGEPSGPMLYRVYSLLALVAILVGLKLQGEGWSILIPLCFLATIFWGGCRLISHHRGRELNRVLRYTNMQSLVTAIIIVVTLLL